MPRTVPELVTSSTTRFNAISLTREEAMLDQEEDPSSIRISQAMSAISSSSVPPSSLPI